VFRGREELRQIPLGLADVLADDARKVDAM